MSDKVGFETSSGNVFEDMGLPNAELELLKADLAYAIYTALKNRNLTQVEAGKLLGINQSEVSRLKNADVSRFTIDRLFSFLNHLDHDIDVYISQVDEGRQGHQRVSVAH